MMSSILGVGVDGRAFIPLLKYWKMQLNNTNGSHPISKNFTLDVFIASAAVDAKIKHPPMPMHNHLEILFKTVLCFCLIN